MVKASERTVMVVDDEPDVRNFLGALIEDAGFNVVLASDGEEALAKLETAQPDLMTLDMVMPRLSGVRTMRRLRRHDNPKWHDLPVIVITAHAHDELGSGDVVELMAEGSRLRPKMLLEKPITPRKLVAAIAEILQVEIELDD